MTTKVNEHAECDATITNLEAERDILLEEIEILEEHDRATCLQEFVNEAMASEDKTGEFNALIEKAGLDSEDTLRLIELCTIVGLKLRA